ncbi:bifunctional 3-phenylpropionate/cinnamic acid dioxygenase ferredoxin subunit [Mycobacterium sp. 141]|uniref:bifunctional 3-phenylpropionate/cinnamic acid dioxygenase ferredoxin subunit n=1 Tax=Mycobacterium sp. 141 TaxID=1120797 RepID=UPI00035DBA62|nr:bifunctional 3-phenylpropionate/cinnamic acid dioxygenase ferredoxin subunit [Mycobacterium sp. 141]
MDASSVPLTEPIPGRIVVGQLDALPVGEVLTVRLPGLDPITIFHTDSGLFAIDDTCTHQDASLADGWVEDCTVECPLHESCFDLRTGEVSGPPAKVAVRTHGVGVEDGQIWLEVSAA